MSNRSVCRFPDHHSAVRSGGSGVLVGLVVLVVLVVLAALAAVRWVTAHWPWFAVPAAAVAAAVVVAAAVRFARLDRAGKWHWVLCRWHRLGFKRLSRNLQLALPDRHRGGIDSSLPKKVNYPRRVRFRPDSFGWTVRFRPSPGVTREDVEKQAESLADRWRCVRVGVSKPVPGKLVLRACRRDPLLAPVGSEVLPVFDGRRLLLGPDEWGRMRYADLAGIAGSVIGGNPGRGKSVAGTALAVQLAPVPNSQWYVLDGGGGADWSCWADRAARFATDNLAEARDVLEEAHAGMVKRLATLAADLGTRNAWTVGPTPDYPLRWVPIDESSVYLDLEAAKALGREAEAHVRAIRGLVMGMMRRGRKVLYHVTLLAQKATSASIPPDIRDLAGLRLCFGVATVEAGIAVLGDDLRQFPSVSPVGLQEDEYVGVCTARLRTGADPYVRLRVPFVTEEQAVKVAQATAWPIAVPDDVSELVG